MKLLHLVLEILCYALPLWAVVLSWKRHKGIAFDHVFLFSVGFVFYFAMPLTLGRTSYFTMYPGAYPKWRDLFDRVTDGQWALYFAVSLALYATFLAGDAMARKLNAGAGWKARVLDLKPTYAIGALGVLIAGITGLPMYRLFFLGYSEGTQIAALGTFTSAVILILSIAVIGTVVRHEDGHPFWRALAGNPFTYIYAFLAVLLLSMGGRIIVLSSLFMVIAFLSIYVRPFRVPQTIAFFVLVIVGSHVVLLAREGFWSRFGGEMSALAADGNLSGMLHLFRRVLDIAFAPTMVAPYLFSENFNVSFSLLDFLTKYSLPVLQFPLSLATGVVSLIPSAIFPDKNAYVYSMDRLGYHVTSPAGCMHVFVSLMTGFGIIGSLAVLFSTSYLLRCCRAAHGSLYVAMYIMVSGWLGMMFFRDLQQVVIKEMLQFSILTPLVIAAASGYMMRERLTPHASTT